jgi:hypothetical protein
MKLRSGEGGKSCVRGAETVLMNGQDSSVDSTDFDPVVMNLSFNRIQTRLSESGEAKSVAIEPGYTRLESGSKNRINVCS